MSKNLFPALKNFAIAALATVCASAGAQEFEIPGIFEPAADSAPAIPKAQVATQLELLADSERVPAGTKFSLLVKMKMAPGWHLYAKEPKSDVGLPPEITWTNVPAGTTFGEWRWSVPARLDEAGLISYVYEDTAFIEIPVEIAADAPVGKTKFSGTTEWLACDAGGCYPASGTIEAEIEIVPASGARVPANAELFATAQKTFSKPGKAEIAPRADEPKKTETPAANANIAWIPWTLAKQNELLDAGKIVYIDFTASWCITCQVNKRVYSDESLQKKFAESGVVTMRADWTKANPEISAELAKYGREAVPFNIFLKKGQPPYVMPEVFAGAGTVSDALDSVLAGTGSSGTPASEQSAWELILLAFAGGLILNLMPCVFPVLGLKIMHFVSKSGEDKRKVARHGLVFGAGVLASFWILAGALIALRLGGEQLGWGFQLQSPVFVFAMILLMFVFGLSMSGVFEFGVSATSAGGSLTQKSGYAGSFFSGVLAVIIATPCAAPFLAPALGAALALDPAPSLGLFTCIALGLAFPYVALSFFPRALKFLPKPGEWMESFKQAMAFLLYAPAAYFTWVLMQQVDGATAQRDLLLSLSAIALACWIYGRWGAAWKPTKTRILAKILAFAIFAGTCAYDYTLL